MSGISAAGRSVPEGKETGLYSYYFERSRPVFVSRLLGRKHGKLLDLAAQGRDVMSMIEIGPGEGFVARAARERGIRYAALEASETGVGPLRDAGFDVRQADVPPLPHDLDPVDLVYASHLVEHMGGPEEVLELLRGCREKLRPGGVLGVVFPDARATGVDFWDCDYTHQWPSTPRRIGQVARDAGLRVTATYHCCLHLHGARARLLRGLWRMYPERLLSALNPRGDDLWYRGKLLFMADVLMVLSPAVGTGGSSPEAPRHVGE